ncbi:potassium channel family protein [Saliphagus sp. GCM10025317]
MRFVIIGAGRVGLRTARVLREEGHEVTLVEYDEAKVRRARGQDFEVVQGDGSREEVLEEAGVRRADALGALTGDLNVNFAACMIAKHHGCRTIMRIDEDYREEIYRKYADEVDDVIYGYNFRSGSEDAWLYDSLTDLDRSDHFPHVRGRGEALALAIGAGASVIGGYVGGIDLAYPFFLAAGVMAVGVGVVYTMPEPRSYPERLGAMGAKNALLGGTIRAIADIAQHLQVVELTITDEAPVRGYTISELSAANATLLAFGKAGHQLAIPTEDESLETGDRLVVLADFDVLSDVRQILVGESPDRAVSADGGIVDQISGTANDGEHDGGN